jgi:hypothetical protein
MACALLCFQVFRERLRHVVGARQTTTPAQPADAPGKSLGHGRWPGGAGAVTADLFPALGFFNRVPGWFTAQVLDTWLAVPTAATSNMALEQVSQRSRRLSIRAGLYCDVHGQTRGNPLRGRDALGRGSFLEPLVIRFRQLDRYIHDVTSSP